MINVPENIQHARHNANLTQVELAERMGVAQSRIYEWETGKKDPTASSLIKIARALGIEPGELLK